MPTSYVVRTFLPVTDPYLREIVREGVHPRFCPEISASRVLPDQPPNWKKFTGGDEYAIESKAAHGNVSNPEFF